MKKTLIIVGAVLVVILLGLFLFFKLSFISKSEVKEIVLEHAGLKESDVKRWSVELDREEGSWEYNVEYVYNNQEYNYDIDAKTGDIILFGVDY